MSPHGYFYSWGDTDLEDKKPVSLEVLSALNSLKERSDSLISEVGRLEIRKSLAISEVKELNEKASALLKQEAKRLGIPPGASWSIDQEGFAVINL